MGYLGITVALEAFALFGISSRAACFSKIVAEQPAATPAWCSGGLSRLDELGHRAPRPPT